MLRERSWSVAARAKPPSRLRQGRGVAPQACRLLAFRKAGKVPTKPAARTRGTGSSKRGPQPPLQGAKRQRRHSAGACPHGASRGTGRKAARAVIGTSTRVRGRGRLLRERSWKRPSETSAADVRYRPVQARASARRSNARIDSGGTPRLEIRKCTSERKTQCLCGFRHLHTCTSEEGMYK